MKAILVSPDERKFLVNAGDRAPLGVLYLSSALEANGVNTRVVDLNHTDMVHFLDSVKAIKPDLLGLSVTSSPALRQMQFIARELRNYTGRIAVGGAHVTFRPKDFEGLADLIVQGPGENRMLDIYNDLDMPEKFDIDKYPIPDRHKLDPNLYNMKIGNNRATGIVTSRGCPYECSFCGNPGKSVQFRSLDNIAEELDIIKQQGYKAVYFYNETFPISKQNAEDIMNLMEKKDLKYRIEARTNLITNQLARHLKDTGCQVVALGIESGDNLVLKRNRKGTTVEDTLQAANILHHHGLPFKGYFIMGLPYQTVESAQKSIDLAQVLHKKGMISADFYALTPFPGSPIAERPGSYGVRVLNNDYKKYLQVSNNRTNAVIETDWMTKEQIEQMCERGRMLWRKQCN